MWKILFSIVISVAITAFASAQNNRVSEKLPAVTSGWHRFDMKRWGVNSVEMPDSLSASDDRIAPLQSDGVTWTNRSARWSLIPNKLGPKFYWVSVDTTTWDVPYDRIAPRMKPELATPAGMLESGVLVDMRYIRERPDLLIQEAGYYDIDGVKGGRSISQDLRDSSRTNVTWWTFRYFEGKPHRVMIQITVANNDVPTAIRIVDSLRLAKTN